MRGMRWQQTLNNVQEPAICAGSLYLDFDEGEFTQSAKRYIKSTENQPEDAAELGLVEGYT